MNSVPVVPHIAAYAATARQAAHLYQQKCTTIIVDVAHFSLRCSTPAEHKDPIAELRHRVEQISRAAPGCQLHLNCDIMFRQPQLALLDQLHEVVSATPIDAIRLSDIGAAAHLRAMQPTYQLCFTPLAGYCTPEAIGALGDLFSMIHLPDEAGQQSIQVIKKASNLSVCYQIFGPVLLQYSDRQFLHAYDPDKNVQQATATDPDNKSFLFLQNQHGHCMFWDKDKSLFAWPDSLRRASIDYWIIENRRVPDAVVQRALSIARSIRDEDSFHLSPEEIQQFQRLCPRALRPGFFLKNNTDSHYKKRIENTLSTKRVARIVGIQRKESVLLHIEKTLSLPFSGTIQHRNGNSFPFSLSQIVDLQGNTFTKTVPDGYYIAPWHRGSQAHAVINETAQ